MADFGLFVGWGEVIAGREQQATQVFGETMEYFGRLQQAGEIAGVEPFFLEPHGGDLGGFFLVSEFKGEMAGKPFQGRSLTGYDPFKKKYVGVWVDSMSPGIYNTEGAFDKSGKVLTETMEGPCPEGKPMRMRLVTQIKDNDHVHFQMHLRGDDGKEALMLEIAYTRKK